MFLHNLKYSFKTLFKNKTLIFWTFAFPIILGTFFSLAFSNIENSEKLDIINIAIVNNEEFKNNQMFEEAFKTLSDKNNKERLFNTKYVLESEATSLLDNKKIDGYLIFENEPRVVVASSGINQTVLKEVTEEISQTQSIMENIAQEQILKNPSINMNNMYLKIYSDIEDIQTKTYIKDVSSENLSYTMIEFYTLIAMACLYGGMLGMSAINKTLANMSNNGKRVSVSPTSKMKLVFSSALASYITQLIGIALLFVYTIFVLDVEYGDNFLLILVLTLAGALAGLTLGIAVSCVFKTNENLKTAIVIAVTMLGCFFSGMMGITMKYIIDSPPININLINPASMITDGFYSLYYYDTLERFNFDLISLLIFSFLMIILSIFSLRRQKYDSI